MKNKGNLLLEFLLNMFIFTVIMLLLLTFIKRAALIQSYKTRVRTAGENTFYFFDMIKKNIKERDKETFLYKGKNSDFFIINNNEISNTGDTVLYRSKGQFYQIKFFDGKFLISSAETPGNFKKNDTLAVLDLVTFQAENELLFITYKINKKIIRQVINIK